MRLRGATLSGRYTSSQDSEQSTTLFLRAPKLSMPAFRTGRQMSRVLQMDSFLAFFAGKFTAMADLAGFVSQRRIELLARFLTPLAQTMGDVNQKDSSLVP